MNQFFGTQYSQEDLQRRVAERRRRNVAARSMSASLPVPHLDDSVNTPGMMGGESLDDIIMQNNVDMYREQGLSQHYGPPMNDPVHDRRASMMEFDVSTNHLNNMPFRRPDLAGNTFQSGRRQSENDISMINAFPAMAMGVEFPPSLPDFSNGMPIPGQLSLDTGVGYPGMPPQMMGNMIAYPNATMNGLPPDPAVVDFFPPTNFTNPFATSNVTQDYTMPLADTETSMSASSNGQQNIISEEPEDQLMIPAPAPDLTDSSGGTSIQGNLPGLLPYDASRPPTLPTTLPETSFSASIASNSAEASSPAMPPKPIVKHNYQNVYSSSGFDMLGALMRVATRKNPEINIGAVDMSCAFVVCDVQQPDCPIIYVSDIFERLTGYNKHEVLGRNCRFLQSPDGKVMQGVKRKYVDDESAYYLRARIDQRKEAQQSIINYRKGGQPFMNLLTMIPIPWDDSDEIRYYVGFQVDLVEQPGSVAGKTPGGAYTVNYSQGLLPRYVWEPPDRLRKPPDSGQTISRDDVSAILGSLNVATESEVAKRMLDKVLLENSDDVVHVLSLKGLFLYLSPSSRHVLEYDASELVGTALSSVCHPCDIVPVTRELKDTSAGTAVNVVFRIRRKRSGYTWFESHGSLCIEQGKGRKCIILVGRERPVYALPRKEIEAAGGIGENELWSKLSTSGMFLFVSSNVRLLLDRQPDELIGTSLQSLMRPESKREFCRQLELSRSGKRVVFKHDIMNKRGQVLQAQTTLYPGDASEGHKPTFLVGQTRLLKSATRPVAPALGVNTNTSVKSMNSLGRSPLANSATSLSGAPSYIHLNRNDTTGSSASSASRDPVLTQAGGAGLVLGSQDVALASEDNIFDELKTTRSTSWQFELRQMEKTNRLLAEELAILLSNKKKRKRRKGAGNLQRDCANCHTRVTPEWRRGPSGQRDLCNSCGLRWAKQNGRVSPRNSSRASAGGGDGSKHSESPVQSSPRAPDPSRSQHARSQSQLSTPALVKQRTNSSSGDSTDESVQNVEMQTETGRMGGAGGGMVGHPSMMYAPPRQGLGGYMNDGGVGVDGGGMLNAITKIDELEEEEEEGVVS